MGMRPVISMGMRHCTSVWEGDHKQSGTGSQPTIGDVAGECHGGLVGPAPGDVPDGVAPTPQQEHGEVVAPHEVHTLCMTWRRGSKEIIN